MNHPQLVVFESDGWLAEQVRGLAQENRWLLREPRQTEACLDLVRETRASLLLLKLQRGLINEFRLLALLRERVPDCPVVVCSDLKLESVAQRTTLAALAYDLGARYVMFPPLTQNLLEDVVSGLMAATIARLNRVKGSPNHA